MRDHCAQSWQKRRQYRPPWRLQMSMLTGRQRSRAFYLLAAQAASEHHDVNCAHMMMMIIIIMMTPASTGWLAIPVSFYVHKSGRSRCNSGGHAVRVSSQTTTCASRAAHARARAVCLRSPCRRRQMLNSMLDTRFTNCLFYQTSTTRLVQKSITI